MKPDNNQQHPHSLVPAFRGHWLLGILLILLGLAGCLTSHAAGPSEGEGAAASVSSATPALSVADQDQAPGVTRTPAITLIPNMAVRALQTSTPTLTATPSLTPTDVPESTVTATPAPTNTPTPTDVPEPTATETPRPTNTPAPTIAWSTPAPFAAFAWLDNYYPPPGSVVTAHGRLLINGRPVNGAHMGVTWRYTHGEGYCSAYTGLDGRATCAQNIGVALQNYWVYIDVVFVHEDGLYYAKTGFVTDP